MTKNRFINFIIESVFLEEKNLLFNFENNSAITIDKEERLIYYVIREINYVYLIKSNLSNILLLTTDKTNLSIKFKNLNEMEFFISENKVINFKQFRSNVKKIKKINYQSKSITFLNNSITMPPFKEILNSLNHLISVSSTKSHLQNSVLELKKNYLNLNQNEETKNEIQNEETKNENQNEEKKMRIKINKINKIKMN